MCIVIRRVVNAFPVLGRTYNENILYNILNYGYSQLCAMCSVFRPRKMDSRPVGMAVALDATVNCRRTFFLCTPNAAAYDREILLVVVWERMAAKMWCRERSNTCPPSVPIVRDVTAL